MKKLYSFLLITAFIHLSNQIEAQPLFSEFFDEMSTSTGTGPVNGMSVEGISWTATSAGTVEDGFGSDGSKFYGIDTDFEVTWTTSAIDVSMYDEVSLSVNFSEELNMVGTPTDIESGCNIPSNPSQNQFNIADVDYFDLFYSFDGANFVKVPTPFTCTASCTNTMNPGNRTIYGDCIPLSTVDDADFDMYTLTENIDVSDEANFYIRVILYNSANTETTAFSNVIVNGTLLPITLTSFTARPTPERYSLLKWETSSEQNNERFEIERSYGGRTFEVIGSVPGAGTTEAAQRYTFTDRAPLPGANYYRLRQVDFDGAFSYSEVRHLAHEAVASQWRLAPVPARDYVQILASGEAPAGPAELYDMLGRLRLNHYLQPADNGRLDLRGLPAGQYVIRYRNGIRRLVKVD